MGNEEYKGLAVELVGYDLMYASQSGPSQSSGDRSSSQVSWDSPEQGADTLDPYLSVGHDTDDTTPDIVGSLANFIGLLNAPELNGEIGMICGFDAFS